MPADHPASGSTPAAYQTPLDPADPAAWDVGEVLPACAGLGGLLDIEYDWDRVPVPDSLSWFGRRWATRNHPLDHSGVWRFRELLPFAPDEAIVTVGEGQTPLRRSDRVGKYCGMAPGHFFLQYEGLNPSGSFKDNGMTAASTHAGMVGAKLAACASTGNTSASLALYAAASGRFRCVVFVGGGTIAFGKLSQALDYGAVTLQIAGDFDDALRRVREVCAAANIYLCNSVNPFRLEGQKTIVYRILEGLGWEVPDWIVLPGGNLGNSSAFGKALSELKHLGLIDRVPRLAIINAAGANTLYRLVERDGLTWNGGEPDEALVGKFYGAMALAKPLLYLGPEKSHIGAFLKQVDAGWSVNHGEVEQMVETIRMILELPSEELAAKGARGLAAIRMGLGRDRLCGEFCDILEEKPHLLEDH